MLHSTVYQKALLTSELREIFDHAPAAPHAVQDRVLSAAWERVTGSPSKEAKAGTVDGAKNAVQGAAKRLLPGEDDTCPVVSGKTQVPRSPARGCAIQVQR